MSGLAGRGWATRVGGAVLASAVLSGCSLLPGSNAGGVPSAEGPSVNVPTAGGPTLLPSSAVTEPPTPAPSDVEPSVGLTAFPTVAVPTARPAEPGPKGRPPGDEGLAYRNRTIQGRASTATWAITVPEFTGAPVAAEVNRRVRAAAGDLIARVKREAKGDGGAKRALTGKGTVVTNDGRTAQVVIVFVDYLAGTASPANYVTTTVVDVRKAAPVLLKQVIQNPPEGLRFLKTEVVKAAKKKGESVDQAGLAPKLANWANWQTTPAGLTFYFEEYQLGGRGLRAYTVPWSAAELVLSAYGEKLLT